MLPSIWITNQADRVTTVLGAGPCHRAGGAAWAIGKSLWEIFRTEDRSYPPIAAHRGALAGRTISFELTRGGQTLFGQVRPIYEADGKLAGSMSVAQDITDLRLLQEERRRLENWIHETSKSHSLRTLAGGLAHKLNNLLTAIVGQAALMREELPANSRFRESLRQIETIGHSVSDITGQMLLYAQWSRQHLQTTDVSRLIQELEGQFKASVSSNVVVEFDLSPGLPAILGDPAQLRHLVNSLFFNAAEAIGDDYGAIVVSTRAIDANRVFLSAAGPEQSLPEGRYVWLHISDTGGGMDEETAKHMFEPFFSTKFVGRGLGLSAAQGIVRSHGGAIWADSRLGHGTTFHVLLPCENVA
jgi:signal transduction histidine kinase